MPGQEGAATIYSGAGMPGCFNLFLPLSGHECTVVDGRRFDRHAIGWMAPVRMVRSEALVAAHRSSSRMGVCRAAASKSMAWLRMRR